LNLLVIRFSALGDVTLSAVVVDALLEANPNLSIWFISKSIHQPLFNKNPRFHFIAADLKGEHKGVIGLIKLFRHSLSLAKFDGVVDLHDVIRSKFLLLLFRFNGLKTICFNKGRKQKNKLLKKKSAFERLPHSTERYLNSFEKLGFSANLNKKSWLKTKKSKLIDKQNGVKHIGIAPFAAHKSKEWGLTKISSLIESLSHCTILLFGGGENEVNQLKELSNKFTHCTLIAGKYSLEKELEIIAELDLMISMDSANMHLASLVGTKVISIWGPTHHYFGFGPLNNEQLIIEKSRAELPCRPCSIYGKINNSDQQKCAEKSMQLISVEQVLEKALNVLNQR
tara:strand:+ start:4934 stop:5953 length:1020 start_codon:yes stop_codon:yes gene_type:complete